MKASFQPDGHLSWQQHECDWSFGCCIWSSELWVVAPKRMLQKSPSERDGSCCHRADVLSLLKTAKVNKMAENTLKNAVNWNGNWNCKLLINFAIKSCSSSSSSWLGMQPQVSALFKQKPYLPNKYSNRNIPRSLNVNWKWISWRKKSFSYFNSISNADTAVIRLLLILAAWENCKFPFGLRGKLNRSRTCHSCNTPRALSAWSN